MQRGNSVSSNAWSSKTEQFVMPLSTTASITSSGNTTESVTFFHPYPSTIFGGSSRGCVGGAVKDRKWHSIACSMIFVERSKVYSDLQAVS